MNIKHYKSWFLYAIFALMAVPSLVARADADTENSVTLNAEVDSEEFHIGDIIKLKVTAENADGYELSFPEKLERKTEFICRGSLPIKRSWGQKDGPGREYVMSIYTTGTHVIYPVPVRYRKEGEEDWRLIESPQVPVDIVSLLAGGEDDIKGLKGLAAFRSGVSRFLLFALAVVVLAGAVFIYVRKNRSAQDENNGVVIKLPHELAYEMLAELSKEDLPGHGQVKEYYSRLSDIARHYLENRFAFRAPEMTTEEFMESVRQSPRMVEEHKKLLEEFLVHCDMVKFAKYGPTEIEMLDSFNSTERLIDQTKEAVKEESQ